MVDHGHCPLRHDVGQHGACLPLEPAARGAEKSSYTSTVTGPTPIAMLAPSSSTAQPVSSAASTTATAATLAKIAGRRCVAPLVSPTTSRR
jgi:hypothetical protein